MRESSSGQGTASSSATVHFSIRILKDIGAPAHSAPARRANPLLSALLGYRHSSAHPPASVNTDLERSIGRGCKDWFEFELPIGTVRLQPGLEDVCRQRAKFRSSVNSLPVLGIRPTLKGEKAPGWKCYLRLRWLWSMSNRCGVSGSL